MGPATKTEVVVWFWDADVGWTAQSAMVRRLSVERVDVHVDGSGPGGLRIEPNITDELVRAEVLKWESRGSSAWAYALPAFRVPFLRRLRPIGGEDR